MTGEVIKGTTKIDYPLSESVDKGVLICIDDGYAKPADTDNLNVEAIGVTADAYEAGQYPCIVDPGSKAYVKTTSACSALAKLSRGLDANAGELAVASGVGVHDVHAILLYASIAGGHQLALIVNQSYYIAS